MDEATKKKYCHLLMFDISEPDQETESCNNGSHEIYNDDSSKSCSNGSSQKASTAAAQTSLTNKPTKQRKTRARKPKRTPRPPNAFILYRKAKQPDVVAQNKNLTNAEVSKVISKMWWKESEEERFQWEKRADRMKLKHMQDYPDYVYQPKKPGTRKRKSTQRNDKTNKFTRERNNVNNDTSSSVPFLVSGKNNVADETITAIAEVAFAVGDKPDRSIPVTSPVSSIPSPPSSIDRSPTISLNQSPIISSHGILHNHRLNQRPLSVNHMTFHQQHHYSLYSQHPPTPTEIYDITPQFLLPPDNYISHENFTSQCFNPIEETSYISPHALTNNNFDSFLNVQPVDKFPYFSASPNTAYSFNSFDTTSVDHYINQSNSTGGELLDELFNNNTTASSSPTIVEDMETYFDESIQYPNRRCSL